MLTRMLPLAMLTVISVGLAGCTLLSGSPAKPVTTHLSPDREAGQSQKEVAWVYTCNDGTRMTALFEKDTVRLFLPGHSLLMQHISDNENGSRYEKDGTIFSTHGDDGTLSFPGAADKICTGARGPGPWDLARLAGVDFRAVGHTPDWVLEMDKEGAIVFTSESVGGRETFPWAKPERKGDQAIWNTRAHGDLLTVMVVKRPCEDDSANETFEATVTVMIGGRTYQGCGRGLE